MRVQVLLPRPLGAGESVDARMDPLPASGGEAPPDRALREAFLERLGARDEAMLTFREGGDRPVGVHLITIKVTGTDKTRAVSALGPAGLGCPGPLRPRIPPKLLKKARRAPVYSAGLLGKPYGRGRLVPGRQSSPEMV